MLHRSCILQMITLLILNNDLTVVHCQKRNALFNMSFADPVDGSVINNNDVPYNPKLRCDWNTTIQVPKTEPQQTLFLNTDRNTLACEPFDSSNPAIPLTKPIAGKFSTFFSATAFLTNGTYVLEKLMDDALKTNGTWSLDLNNEIPGFLATPGNVTWKVKISVAVKPKTTNSKMNFDTSFNLINAVANPYLSAQFGTLITLSSVASGSNIFIVQSPCSRQVTLAVVSSNNDHVYFGRSKNTNAIAFEEWFDYKLDNTCILNSVTALVRYVVLHTSCGALMSNDLTLTAGAPVTFKIAPKLADYAPQIKSHDSASTWCYDVSVLDSFSLRSAVDNRSGVVLEPFDQISYPLTFPNISDDTDPNVNYRSNLFPVVQTEPKKIVATYKSPSTGIYLVLYKKNDLQLEIFSNSYRNLLSYSAGPSYDLHTSQPILTFNLTDFPGYSDAPGSRFVANPYSDDVFLIIGREVWLRSADGGSVAKVFNLTSWDSTDEIVDLLFARNGMRSYVITKNRIFQGISYHSTYVLIVDMTAAALLGSVFASDSNGTLYYLQPNRQPVASLVPLPAPDSPLQDPRLNGAAPLVYSILPYTSRLFCLIHWAGLSTATAAFSPGDIGREIIQQKSDGQGRIISIFSPRPNEPASTFLTNHKISSVVLVKRSKQFTAADTTPSTVSSQSMTITFTSDADIELATTSTPWTGFQYATVVVDDPASCRATFILSDTGTKWLSLQPNTLQRTCNSGAIVKKGSWTVIKYSPTSDGALQLGQDQNLACPFKISVNRSLIGPANHVMDRGDSLQFKVHMQKTGKSPVDDVYFTHGIVHQAGNLWRLQVHSEMSGDWVNGWDLQYTVEEVGADIQDNKITTLSFQVGNPLLGCGEDAMLSFRVVSGCPKGTDIKYAFPDGLDSSQWTAPSLTNKMEDFVLGPLPVNYRPPSDEGTAFPTSSNIYNADPAISYKPYFGWQSANYPVIFKQCQNATDRSGCQCPDGMKRSMSSKYTECLQNAVYLPYPGDHSFKFNLRSWKSVELLDPHIPIFLKEINNRSDFTIAAPVDLSNSTIHWLDAFVRSSMPNLPAVYGSNSTIRFTGTGLFHFEASMFFLHSYCTPVANIMLFLYSATLPFPMGQVCQCWMALLIALWLFSALRFAGEQTLLDYVTFNGIRGPDRIPLRGEYIDVDEWNDEDLETHPAVARPKDLIKEKDEYLSSKEDIFA